MFFLRYSPRFVSEDNVPTSSAAAHGWGMRQPLVLRSPETDRTGPARTSHAVLVVDDDRNLRRLTARMLRAQGYRAMEAGSGMEALQMLQSDPGISLVVTDIVMPEMDGLDLADRAMADLPALRVVLMTGHAPQLSTQLEAREHRLPVLLKPFTAEQLAEKVREALEGM
jgi:DNA-binding NtrC family response regulator